MMFQIDFIMFVDGEIAGTDPEHYGAELQLRKGAATYVAQQIRSANAENRDIKVALTALRDIPRPHNDHLARLVADYAILIGVCAVLTCGLAVAQNPSEFAATDAKLKACVARDSSNMHIMACNFVAQISANARLNNVYQVWTEVLQHPKPDEAKDDAEILKRLVAAEQAWIAFRDTDCSLQSTSMLGGTGKSNVYGDCVYAITKLRVKALEAARNAR